MRMEEKNGNIFLYDFNEIEAYKIACKVEKDGLGIYNYFLRKVKDASLQDMFTFLSKQEEEHYKYFRKRLDELLKDKNASETNKLDQIISLLDVKIFPSYSEVVEKANKIKDEKELLNLAINVENKSINFYTACLGNEKEENVKKELKKIITEETKHKLLLEGSIK